MEITLKTTSKSETITLGKKVSKLLKPHDVITLKGDLGAGKTTFVNGVAKGLNVKGSVVSPTFNILKCYFDASIPLFHIDAYRLEDKNKDIGLEEYIEGEGIAVIEWPEFISYLLNIPHLEIKILNKGGDKREFIFKAEENRYINIIKELR